MPDLQVENYKNSVAKIVDRWETEIKKHGKALEPLDKELKDAKAKKDKAAEKEIEKKRAPIKKKTEAATKNLELNLKLIEIPPSAPEKELVKLPGWLKTVIQKKGIPLGPKVSIAPDIAIDAKKKKVKKIGITIRW